MSATRMNGRNVDGQWEQVLQGFGEIQEELNYQQAQDSLRELLANLDLSPQERMGLETEIHNLEAMQEKLDRTCVHIAVFGMVGRGKSSVLNALLGQNLFETGPTHGVTRAIHSADWQIQRESVAGTAEEILQVTLPSQGDSQIQLIDTPGIDEVRGEQRAALAHQVAKQADLILFVVAGDITQVEYEALSQLRSASKPMLLVFNKIDQYPDADRLLIYQKIRDERVKELLSPEEIVMAAAAPLVAQRGAEGRRVELKRGLPQVEDLKLKILEILDREGKSLVALNTMLYADGVNEQVVRRKMEIRDHAANQIIWNGVMLKALATAVNPITVLDILSAAAIDVAMILTLSKLYGIQMTQQGAVSLLQKIALAMGGISASELLANLGLSGLKSLLGLATPVTGGAALAPYLSVAVTQAGVAGVSSYGIGQVTKAYLANGAAWGPDGPKAVVTSILASLDERSILSRIKDELRASLRRFEE